MQPEHPLQSPSCFIQNVSHEVRPTLRWTLERLAQAVELIFKIIKIRNVFCIAFDKVVSEQHLRGCIARRQKILQLIASIMPTTRGVDVSSRGFWSKRSAAVEAVTHGVDERVVATSLLAH